VYFITSVEEDLSADDIIHIYLRPSQARIDSRTGTLSIRHIPIHSKPASSEMLPGMKEAD